MAAAGVAVDEAGPLFLSGYLLIGIVATVLSGVRRAAVVRSWAPIPEPSLSPTELGMLVGEQRAMMVALAWLRVAGAIDRRGVTVLGLRVEVDPLTAEVYRRISAGHVMWMPSLRVAAGSTLDGIRSDLVAQKLIVGTDYRRAIGWCAAPIAVVVLIGMIRLFLDVIGGRSIAILFILIVLFVILGAAVASTTAWWADSLATPFGSRLLVQARRSNDHLRPQRRPSYATYGSTSAAMSVALFGPAAFILLDPEFAEELGVTEKGRSEERDVDSGDRGDGIYGGSCSGG